MILSQHLCKSLGRTIDSKPIRPQVHACINTQTLAIFGQLFDLLFNKYGSRFQLNCWRSNFNIGLFNIIRCAKLVFEVRFQFYGFNQTTRHLLNHLFVLRVFSKLNDVRLKLFLADQSINESYGIRHPCCASCADRNKEN